MGKEEPESSVKGGMRVKQSTHGLKSDGSLTLDQTLGIALRLHRLTCTLKYSY